jgi:hypothetical protein
VYVLIYYNYERITVAFSDKSVIDQLISKVKDKEFKKQIKDTKKWIGHVMIYELLIGEKRKIEGGGAIKRLIVSHQNQLEEALNQLKKESGVEDTVGLLPESSRRQGDTASYERIHSLHFK